MLPRQMRFWAVFKHKLGIFFVKLGPVWISHKKTAAGDHLSRLQFQENVHNIQARSWAVEITLELAPYHLNVFLKWNLGKQPPFILRYLYYLCFFSVSIHLSQKRTKLPPKKVFWATHSDICVLTCSIFVRYQENVQGSVQVWKQLYKG